MTTSEVVHETGHAGELSLLCPAAHPDALDWFKYLQQNAPVYQDEDGRYVLTRYEDVYGALRAEPELFSSLHELTTTDVPEADARWVVYSDDPDHLEVRRLVNRGWTPAAVAELEPRMRANLDAVLAALEPGKEFDVYPAGADFIKRSFADAVGLPPEQRARLDVWTLVSGNFIGPRERRAPQSREPEPGVVMPGHAPGFQAAYGDMEAYFSGLVERHREHDPKFCKEEEGLPPFARAIVASAKEKPENLTTFLRRVYPPLHAGGVSTVTHMFVNMVDVLLDNPEVWTRLREDRSLIATDRPSEVIEEILRLKSVHAGLHKRPTRDIELHGTVIPAGSMVQFYYLAADHDPDVFEDPEQFKPRGLSRHLAFGFGTHTCLGQSFARLGMKLFLDGLLNKFSRIERGSELPDWSFKGTYYTPPKLLVVGYV